jgi:hypothetical protein
MTRHAFARHEPGGPQPADAPAPDRAGAAAASSTAYKYWAFITYSHADERWARWLHRALESYRVPRRVVGRPTPQGPAPARLFPVFRDRDELAGSPELGPELQRALEQSRWQIVVCSPQAARSHWVNEEIRHFKSLGRSDRVLALIVDGEPHSAERPDRECFPPALKVRVDATGALTDEPAEPIAADARPDADGRGNAKLKLIAGLLGVPYDELRQRELHARNRRLAVAAAMASTVAAVTVVLAILAYQARNDALRRQQQAEDLLQFMLGDLRDKLEPIGKLSILDAVGQKAMDYFATLRPSDMTDAALGSRATALRQIGDVRIKQGDMPGAVAAFREAHKLDAELVARHPADTNAIRNVSHSEFSMGYAHYVKGEHDAALPWWTQRAETARRLAQLDPGPDAAAILVDADTNVGALRFARRELDAAAAAFASALAMQQRLLQQEPDKRQHLENLASLHGWLCTLATERRDWPTAVQEAQRRAEPFRRLLELEPDNAPFRLRLAKANLQTLYAESYLRPVAPTAAALRETLDLTAALTALDPDNVEYAHSHAVALNYLVDAHLTAGQAGAAERIERTLLDLTRETLRRAPANAVAIEDRLAVLAQAAKLAWLRNDAAGAAERLREARTIASRPDQLKASPPARWLDLALLEWWIAPRKSSAARREGAEAWLERVKASGAAVKPDLMLRYEALRGNLDEARKWAQQLNPIQRAHPFVQQFCSAFAVCAAGEAVAASAPP